MITHAPEIIAQFQTAMMLLLMLGNVLGILLFISAKAQRNRMYFQQIERTLVSQLIISKFSVTVFQLTAKSVIKPFYIEKFLRTRAKKSGNFINVNEKGIVTIKKFEMNSPKRK